MSQDSGSSALLSTERSDGCGTEDRVGDAAACSRDAQSVSWDDMSLDVGSAADMGSSSSSLSRRRAQRRARTTATESSDSYGQSASSGGRGGTVRRPSGRRVLVPTVAKVSARRRIMAAYEPSEATSKTTRTLLRELECIDYRATEMAHHEQALADLSMALRALLAPNLAGKAPPVSTELLLFLQGNLTAEDRENVWRALTATRRFAPDSVLYGEAASARCLAYGSECKFAPGAVVTKIGGKLYDTQLVLFWLCFARHTTLVKLAPNPLLDMTPRSDTSLVCPAGAVCVNPNHIGTAMALRSAATKARDGGV
jgi:hypothetical protein